MCPLNAPCMLLQRCWWSAMSGVLPHFHTPCGSFLAPDCAPYVASRGATRVSRSLTHTSASTAPPRPASTRQHRAAHSRADSRTPQRQLPPKMMLASSRLGGRMATGLARCVLPDVSRHLRCLLLLPRTPSRAAPFAGYMQSGMEQRWISRRESRSGPGRPHRSFDRRGEG
eukprot:349801-Chlamydomonas_euryale.AAC.52